MVKVLNMIWRLICIAAMIILCNFILVKYINSSCLWMLAILIPVYIIFNVVPSFNALRNRKFKYIQSQSGIDLLWIFLGTTFVTVVFSVLGWIGVLDFGQWDLPGLKEDWGLWLKNGILTFFIELVVFWNGIIRIYLTSTQLGIKFRVIGAICGMIPVVNLVVLVILIRVVRKELNVELEKIKINDGRAAQKICQTKYPILMVHGVFFRDFRYFNYWGRVPDELIANGATIYYGNHQSAASVEECGKELAQRVMEIVAETGCDKVNIIAHSKGGLDSRYAISKLGIADHVASLSTINTPHRGCDFADFLVNKIPEAQKQFLADNYNKALKIAGDPNPDFIAAVTNLTATSCAKFNEEVFDAPGVYYQSVGSTLKKASGGRFPLNYSYHLVNLFDGKNDGLVGEKSFPWGQKFTMVQSTGKRGISHGDMIDLNRENFEGFDVREFFVQIVSGLKQMGF